MLAVGMKVVYKSGEFINDEQGVIVEERFLNGKMSYKVRWNSGKEGWYVQRNLKFV